MSSVTSQRVAILVVTALLLGFDFTAARVSAAVVAVVFYCWFVGLGEPRRGERQASARR